MADVDRIHEITMIDEWFLYKIFNIIKMERRLQTEPLTDQLYLEAKKMAFLDKVIEEMSGQTIANKRHAVFKMVDTCAAEFAAETPYFYSTYDDENEAAQFLEHRGDKKSEKRYGYRIRLRSDPYRPGNRIRLFLRTVCMVSEESRI